MDLCIQPAMFWSLKTTSPVLGCFSNRRRVGWRNALLSLTGSAAASSASIKKDDELLEIDGQPVLGEFITDVHKMLVGEVGSVVTLTMARRDDKEKYKVVLLRARISTHASDALKDISTFLRLDNKDWKLFQLSLVDILADPLCEFTLFKNALKVSVGLLLPIELIDKDADPSSLNKADLSSRSIHINQVNERIREMKNFLSQPRNHKAIIVTVKHGRGPFLWRAPGSAIEVAKGPLQWVFL
jgi:hypothetical protein